MNDDLMQPMSDDFIKLADQYEGNLLNYFCGMSPKQSKKFNKMVRAVSYTHLTLPTILRV